MHIRNVVAALALLGTLGTSAHAQGSSAADAAPAASTPAATAAAATAAADADKPVCKTERPMGSLIPKRVCKTAAQWEAEREQSRKMIQDMQQRTGSTSGR
jgi:uncharacterized protein (DUF2342 family)